MADMGLCVQTLRTPIARHSPLQEKRIPNQKTWMGSWIQSRNNNKPSGILESLDVRYAVCFFPFLFLLRCYGALLLTCSRADRGTLRVVLVGAGSLSISSAA